MLTCQYLLYLWRNKIRKNSRSILDIHYIHGMQNKILEVIKIVSKLLITLNSLSVNFKDKSVNDQF